MTTNSVKSRDMIHIIQLGSACLGHGETLEQAYADARSYFDDLEPLDEIPAYRPRTLNDGDCCVSDDDEAADLVSCRCTEEVR